MNPAKLAQSDDFMRIDKQHINLYNSRERQ